MSELNKDALFRAGRAIQTTMKGSGGGGVTFSELAALAIQTYCKDAGVRMKNDTMTAEKESSTKTIERELAEKWMKAAVDYGDQAKATSVQLLIWKNNFLRFANHKFDCSGNDGTVCECGYLQLWQEAFDACGATS